MLNLFKEEDHPLSSEASLKRAKEILVSCLNKGVIPEWDQFYSQLPASITKEDFYEIKKYFTTMTDWDFLQELIVEEATEFFFHSPEKIQILLNNGKKIQTSTLLSREDWQTWLEIISLKFKQNWNVQNPYASFYGNISPQNFRFTLIHCSTSPHQISKLILRSLASRPHPLCSFGETEKLKINIRDKKNMLIAGATGSGKTSLLTSLLGEIPHDEHLVILEDTYEIIFDHPHQTRFLAGDSAEKSLKSYLSYSLRMSPDRIILGEMRSHEVVPFLMAMNTGHRGLLGTIHASSAVDALHRFSLLFSIYSGEAQVQYDRVMELICQNLEYVVFMEHKKVKEVIRILGSDRGVPFFERV